MHAHIHIYTHALYMCVCVCERVCVRACVRACVCNIHIDIPVNDTYYSIASIVNFLRIYLSGCGTDSDAVMDNDERISQPAVNHPRISI